MLLREETCGRLTLDGHLPPTCSCYEEGYGQGKKALELEIEAWTPDGHFDGFGCLPCRFVRRIREYDRRKGGE